METEQEMEEKELREEPKETPKKGRGRPRKKGK